MTGRLPCLSAMAISDSQSIRAREMAVVERVGAWL